MEKVNHEYGADQIQVLEGLEAVRKRPGMYIGSTTARGLHHLVYEIVDNSVDEALAGYCTDIKVTIEKGDIIRVEDNGRGIPIGIHAKTGLSAAETVYTVLHAGGKFGGDSGYKVSGGLHGVGASVVNALSIWTEVQIKREGGIYQLKFDHGKTVQKLTKIGETKETGTTVRFLPDDTIFDTTTFNFDTLEIKLREIAFLTKGLNIILRDERDENNIQEVKHCYEGGLNSFVEFLNKSKEPLHSPPIYISKEVNEIPIEIAIQYTTSYSENILSFVNNINTIEGGTHLEGFKRALTKTLNDYAREKNLIKEKDLSLTGDDLREGITGIISVKLKNPQFEGQTKTKLGNGEALTAVNKVVSDELAAFLEENPNIATTILKKSLDAARARNAARKARDLARRKTSLDSMTLPGKLADCIQKEAEGAELFIVEGDSAAGTAKSGRDRRNQAILALWGKMLNVEKARLDKIIGNDKLQPVIQSVGAGVGKDFDITKIRYSKIIIMADADVDGEHIRTLLLTFFYRYMRPLVENGNVYLAQPPLYKVTKKGFIEKYCYSDKELQEVLSILPEDIKDKVDIQRYKGLGEMDAIQLWETTMNPEQRLLVQVQMEDAAYEDEVFSTLMGDEVEPRRDFIVKYAKLATNIDV